MVSAAVEEQSSVDEANVAGKLSGVEEERSREWVAEEEASRVTTTAVDVVAEEVGGLAGGTTSRKGIVMPPSTSSPTGRCWKRSISCA